MSSTSITQDQRLIQTLALNVCTKLPRELRDIIYSYFCDKDTVQAIPFAHLLEPCRHEIGCCGDHLCTCKILPVGSPIVINKAVLGPQCVAEGVAEALEWIFRNSREIAIGAPNQLIRFFTVDFLGVGVKAEDFALRKLACIIPTSQYSTSTSDSELAPLLRSKLRSDFTLKIHVRHTDATSAGANHLVTLTRMLFTVMDRLQARDIPTFVTFEHPLCMPWNITKVVRNNVATTTLHCMLMMYYSNVSQYWC